MSADMLRRAAKTLWERVAELPERIRDGIWEQDSSLDQDLGIVQDSGTAGAIDIARAILREGS